MSERIWGILPVLLILVIFVSLIVSEYAGCKYDSIIQFPTMHRIRVIG